MSDDGPLYECPVCGEGVGADEEHDCSEATPVAREDACPMCGDDYDSWLAHLSQCRVRERHEVEVASETDDETPGWEDRPDIGQKGRPE